MLTCARIPDTHPDTGSQPQGKEAAHSQDHAGLFLLLLLFPCKLSLLLHFQERQVIQVIISVDFALPPTWGLSSADCRLVFVHRAVVAQGRLFKNCLKVLN